jgi:hypothetical protein
MPQENSKQILSALHTQGECCYEFDGRFARMTDSTARRCATVNTAVAVATPCRYESVPYPDGGEPCRLVWSLVFAKCLKTGPERTARSLSAMAEHILSSIHYVYPTCTSFLT